MLNERGDDRGLPALRPFCRHAQLLFTKSDNLIRCFKTVEEAVTTARSHLATDQLQAFEQDKNDVAEVLYIGQEITRRRIRDILKPSKKQDVSRDNPKNIYSDGKLEQTANLFETLRNERQEQNDNVEEVVRSKVFDGPGVYPLIQHAKKGVKRLTARLPLE